MSRCPCNTKRGDQCSRMLQEDARACWQHSTNIIIYTLPTCPYSINAKKLLSQYNMHYKEISVKGNQKSDLIKQTGHRTMPQIFINDEFIGGYDDLVNLIT